MNRIKFVGRIFKFRHYLGKHCKISKLISKLITYIEIKMGKGGEGKRRRRIIEEEESKRKYEGQQSTGERFLNKIKFACRMLNFRIKLILDVTS